MNGITIDLSPTPLREGGIEYTQLPDGGLELNYAPDAQAQAVVAEHDANLAETLSPKALNAIADQVVEWVEADQEAREDWKTRFEKGLEVIGVIEEGGEEGPFPGAAKVVHPLIMEAAIQFQSRSIKELFPPAGPVKTIVLGAKTSEREAQALRVEGHMNYQMTVEDRSYFWDVDQMLLWLPLVGSCFKKSYYDARIGQLRSRFIKGADVLVPYTAKSMEDAPRFTHVFELSQTELRRRQLTGEYVDTELPEPAEPIKEAGDDAIDEVDDRTPNLAEGDAPHTLYECHCEYEIPGESQEGLPLPFIITVEKDSRAVLAIRRNWKVDDERKSKRGWFTHYKFFPGLGFYGFGYIHAIGSLGKAATGALRALLDSGAFATMQGGFKSKDARIAGKDIVLEPGVYHDTEMTAEELQKAFYTPPFKEPSPALVQLFQLLVEAGQRFASMTDVITGDATNNAPVGTTLALIEQSSQPFSAIHKRLHVAAGEEFRLRAELNAEYLPPFYPYEVHGEDRGVYATDYDARVDVVPVSDPNIFSSTQRIAMAQGVLELANSAPQMYDTYEAHKRMLEAMRVPDIDTLLPDPNDIPHADPVSEGAYLFVGKPVRAHVDEDHAAHLIIHQAQMQTVVNSPLAETVQAALMAHIAEHVALQYQIQMSQLLGLPLPQPDLSNKKREGMDVAIANQIAMQAAMGIQNMQAMQQAQMQQQVQAEQEGEAQAAQAENARADEGMQAEQQRKDAAFQADEERKNLALEAQITRDQIKAASDYLKQVGAMDIDPMQLIQTARELGTSFDEALRILREAQMGGLGSGQGQGPAPIAQEAL
jgi:hypothetical protein